MRHFRFRKALFLGFLACLSTVAPLAWTVTASAQSAPGGGSAEPPPPIREYVEKSFDSLMKLNLITSKALPLAKAALKGDPFALVDAIVALFAEDGAKPDITVMKALQQITAQMDRDREETFRGRADGLMVNLSDLMMNPHNDRVITRFEAALADGRTLQQELETVMNNGDQSRAAQVAHLVPIYNTVISAVVIGLSMEGVEPETIAGVYAEAIKTNSALVSDNDNYGGYLYNYTVAQYGDYECCGNTGDPVKTCYHCSQLGPTTGTFSTCQPGVQLTQSPPACNGPIDQSVDIELRRRIDSDPTIYLIRRTIVDQQLALL